ncbi:uncharacterized protein Bfra_007326 [Botrytis fragariae]|uniref:Uncharacterized protein n=1 Tax=Botrytis fragariae TaxID=1964551 RepID=A0A8H6AIX0_9HELO|nr:uncharacterized protein Bfra_007326 [Botrytis fragariae]KAF5868130.1 hypothetical protein Bfra_007326 [Botrytis fragariae]
MPLELEKNNIAYKFEWDEPSLGILKARVDKLPFDMKMDRRKKDYVRLRGALDFAKDAGKVIEAAPE